MDDITHALAGTLLARSIPSKQKGLTLACVAGALAPDLDVLLTLEGRDYYLTEHRGFTHSLWGLAPMALLGAGVAWLWVRKRQDAAPYRILFLLALLGVASHDFLDWCTSWGTMLLWPNRTRFALDHLFIIDLWYAALLALPLVLSAFLKPMRTAVCWGGLLAVAGYHGLAAAEHHRALESVGRERAQAELAAFPQPFSPFRWSAYSRQGGILRNAQLDFLKSPSPLRWQEWKEPPLTQEIQAAMASPVIQKYLWFARVPAWEEEKQQDGSSLVRFWDNRFYVPLQGEEAPKHFGAVVTVKEGKVIDGRLGR